MRVTATARNRMGDTYNISNKHLKATDVKILKDGVISFYATMNPYNNSSTAEYTGTFEFSLDELRMILEKAEEVESEAREKRLETLESKLDELTALVEGTNKNGDETEA